MHKRYVNSIADPFFYQLWMAAFAYLIPLFLFLTKTIGLSHFLYFIFSESFFWIGFYIFSFHKKSFSQIEILNDEFLNKSLFVFALFIYVLSTFLTYYYLGIPLFHSNRNDVFKDAGGLGVLSRLNGFSVTFLLVYTFCKLDRKNKKYYFLIFVIVINLIFSGGKSAILSVVYSYFYYSFFIKKTKPRLSRKYISLLILFPVIVLLGSSASSSVLNSIIDLLTRIVANGDIYWCAYPNDVINKIEISHPISHLLISFLGPMRIIPYEQFETMEPIGLLINWEVNPELAKLGITNSPNSRLAITGWVYFKWYGILFSFLLGCMSSYLIFQAKKFFPRNIFGIVFYSSLYFSALGFVADPGLAVSYLFDSFFNITIYTIVLFTVNGLRIKYKLLQSV